MPPRDTSRDTAARVYPGIWMGLRAAATSSSAPKAQVKAFVGVLMPVFRREFKSPLGYRLMHTGMHGLDPTDFPSGLPHFRGPSVTRQ